MVIGIWSGNKKPCDTNEYLMPLASDIQNVILNGVQINGYRILLSIRSFLCDGPARSLIKC